MVDSDADWRVRDIKQRLERAARDSGVPNNRVASLKIRHMRLGANGKLAQSYLDGHDYSEIRHCIDYRLDHGWRPGSSPVQFEEHESGPELIIDLANLGLAAIGTIVAVVGMVIQVVDRKKQTPVDPSPSTNMLSIELRTIDGDKLREAKITVIAPDRDVDKMAAEAKKIVAALEKAAKKK